MNRPLILTAAAVSFLAAQAASKPAAAVSPEEIQKIRAAAPEKAFAEPQKPRRLLVFTLCNGYRHSSIPYITKALEVIGRKTGAFEIARSKDMSVFTADGLAAFDAVCLNNCTKLDFSDPAKQHVLLDFVANGGGIAAIHGATDNFYDWPEGAALIGGLFDGHPWRAEGTWAVKVEEPDHPVAAAFGTRNFKINDELYRIKTPYSRRKLRVLASLDMDDEINRGVKDLKPSDIDIPVCWIAGHGKGRVFYTSIGHNHDVTWNPMVLRHYLAGVQFALGDIEADTTSSFEHTLDSLLPKVAKYDYGDSRLPLSKLAEFIKMYYGSTAQLSRIEGRLLEVLETDSTFAGKQFVCKQLSLIGTERSVPVLAGMLTDEKTNDMARYALERIPGDRAGEALRKALGQTKGLVRIGIINTIGQRGDQKAVDELAGIIYESDLQAAAAAVGALAKIPSDEASDVLTKATDETSGSLRTAAMDAALACAERLRTSGQRQQALAAYRRFYKPGLPATIRTAALRGIVLSSSDKDAGRVIIETLKGGDKAMQTTAVGLLGEIGTAESVEAVAGEMPNLSSTGQVRLLTALRARGLPAALPAVVKAVGSSDGAVREAALRALGSVGDQTVVDLLATSAAEEVETADTASESLNRLRGKDVDDKMIKLFPSSGTEKKKVLIRSMAARRNNAASSLLLQSASHADESIRAESFKALESLAGPQDVPALVALLLDSADNAGRRAAGRALIAACKRMNDEVLRTRYLLDGLKRADEEAKISLLGVLGRFGGKDALAAVEAALSEESDKVATAAVRSLAGWPTPEPAYRLLEIAQGSESELLRVLAVRGCIDMAGMIAGDEPEKALSLYKEAFAAADRPDEKKLVLAGVQKIDSPQSLAFIEPNLDDSNLAGEAKVAYFAVAVGLAESHPQLAQKALERILNAEGASKVTLSRGSTEILKPADGTVIAPLQIKAGPGGISYAVVATDVGKPIEPDQGGRLVYMFTAAEPGTLSMEFHINCDNINNDSWYIRVNNGPYLTWNDNVTATWEWRKLPQQYDVKKGLHVLTIDQREDGAKMAEVKLTLR